MSVDLAVSVVTLTFVPVASLMHFHLPGWLPVLAVSVKFLLLWPILCDPNSEGAVISCSTLKEII